MTQNLGERAQCTTNQEASDQWYMRAFRLQINLRQMLYLLSMDELRVPLPMMMRAAADNVEVMFQFREIIHISHS